MDSNSTHDAQLTSLSSEFFSYANQIKFPWLYLGSEDAAHLDPTILKSVGITHILICGFGLKPLYPKLFTYKQIHAIDLPIYRISRDFPAAFKFLSIVKNAYNTQLENTKQDPNTPENFEKEALPKVLVHCAMGKSRSAAFVVGFLIHDNPKLSYPDAVHIVKSCRPTISINSGFQRQLREFAIRTKNKTTKSSENTK